MLTKAIIKGVNRSTNKYIVRIPILESLGNSSSITGEAQMLFDAVLCYSPGTIDGLRENDIVFVGFEDNRYNNIVILGKLYQGEESTATASQTLNTLSVNGSTVLNGTVRINGVDFSLVNEHNQAINNLVGKTDEDSNNIAAIRDELSSMNLNDWIIKGDGYNLNFYRNKEGLQ